MKHLFVCGCPRSGTTALGTLLNRHPSIALGIERFKHIAMGRRGAEFGPALFEHDRFLDILAEDTNTIGQNKHLAKKFATTHEIRMVGDKIPRLYRRLPFLREAFPGAALVVIFRDPVAVALSWQARADSPKDQWPAENGADKALEEWQVSVDAVSEEAAAWGKSLTIIDYDRFFRVPDALTLADNTRRLFGALGLKMQDTNLLRAAEALRGSAPSSGGKREPATDIVAKAAILREGAAFQALMARAV